MVQTQKHASLALVLLDSGGLTLRKRSRRASLEHSIFRGSIGPISIYRSWLPTRTLAAHFAGTIPKGCANAQKLVDAFRKSVRYSIQKLTNHPEPSQRKQRKK